MINTINERNKIKLETDEMLLGNKGNIAIKKMLPIDIKNRIGALRMIYLIDNTEHLITLVDGLLLEGNDFLLNFTEEIKSEIDIKKLNKFGLKFLTFSNSENESRMTLMKQEVTLDYKAVADISGRSEDMVKSNYDISQVTKLLS